MVSKLWERASLRCQCFSGGHGWPGDAPLDLGTDHVDDLVRQAGNVLVAEVDGDAGLLLLLCLLLRLRLGRLLAIARGIRGGVACAALGDVLAGLGEGGLGQGHDLVVRDGRGRVVAHGRGRGRAGAGLMARRAVERRRWRRREGGGGAEVVVEMQVQVEGRSSRASGRGQGREDARSSSRPVASRPPPVASQPTGPRVSSEPLPMRLPAAASRARNHSACSHHNCPPPALTSQPLPSHS